MKNKFIHVYEIDPSEFKNEILMGVEMLLNEFSDKFTPKEPEIWMSRKEVGELLGISLVTIHAWSKNGLLKAYKIGNRVRFRRSEIEQSLLNSNKKALE